MSPFTVIIDGDRRLSVANYRYLRTQLDRLLANRLPDVRVLSGAGLTIDIFAQRWAEEHGLPVERFPGGRNHRTDAQYVEWVMAQNPTALVVFDGGAGQSTELFQRVRARDLPVRVVDVRMLVDGKE